MKKTLFLILCFFLLSGFKAEDFSIDRLDKYEKEFKSEVMDVCSSSSTKTYEPYTAITNKSSPQYKYIRDKMTIHKSGILFDHDGFIGAALGYSFGPIGSRYYFTLDSGVVLPIVKVDSKAAEHAPDGCSASGDASVIEFVIDVKKANKFFGDKANGLVNSGNFNNDSRFKGKIVGVEKVSGEKLEAGVYYEKKQKDILETSKHSDKSLNDEVRLDGVY